MRTLILTTCLLFCACPDGDTSTTTFDTIVTTFSTMSSPSTNATVFDSNPTEQSNDSEAESGSTFGVSETSASPTTNMGGMSSSEATSTSTPEGTTTGATMGATTGESESTGTDESTTGEGATPLPDPPQGCAHFVEWVGRHAEAFRHVTIDTSTCPRAAVVTVEFGAVAPTPSSFEFGVPTDGVNFCFLIGGPQGPAAIEPGGIILTIVGPENLIAWQASLLVDGEVSDDVRVPDVLVGQHWMLEPIAPAFPIRRREDWSWVPRAEEGQVPGCELVAVF